MKKFIVFYNKKETGFLAEEIFDKFIDAEDFCNSVNGTISEIIN